MKDKIIMYGIVFWLCFFTMIAGGIIGIESTLSRIVEGCEKDGEKSFLKGYLDLDVVKIKCSIIEEGE